MEVGNQCIHALKFIPGINKNAGVIVILANTAVLGCHRLNGAAGGGTHSNHPTAVCLGTVDQLRRLSRHVVVLRVHFVLGHIFHLNRTEGTQPNMQCHIADIDAHGLNIL